MGDVMQLIEKGIREYFPEMDGISIHADLELMDIGGWDSMSMVNLQVYLEENSQAEIPEDLLEANKTVGDVVAVIEQLSED